MSEYDKLKVKFDKAVKELRENCPHTEISDWMDEWWAIGHSTGRKVRVCLRCGAKTGTDGTRLKPEKSKLEAQ